MLRLRNLVVASAMVSLLACSGGEEQQLLSRFFMACRSGDNTTIASVSQVGLPGAETCEAWEVLEVAETRSEPFKLIELREQLIDAKKERDVQFEKGKYFLEDNYNDIEKIQLRLDRDPGYKFSGKLGEVQQEWEKIIADRKTLERAVQEINREVEKEIKLAKMSLLADAPINNMEGNVLTKRVDVSVTQSGQAIPYVFTLMKYDLMNPQNNVAAKSRWIIVGIDEKAT